MQHTRRAVAVSILALVGIMGLCQAVVSPPSDSQAVALTGQARTALRGLQVSDLLLNANAVWIAGGTSVSGTAVLKTKGPNQARLDIESNASSRSEIRNDANGADGQWIGPDGARHPMVLHNCWTPASWFAPHALVQTMSGPNAVLRYAGRETRNGLPSDHVQFHPAIIEKNPQAAQELEKLATSEVFFDASTHLPAALIFNTHPDNDAGRDIPVEIRFGDYRNVDGVMVPFHIQRYLQGVLNLDLTVTAAAINHGLADGEFALQ